MGLTARMMDMVSGSSGRRQGSETDAWSTASTSKKFTLGGYRSRTSSARAEEEAIRQSLEGHRNIICNLAARQAQLESKRSEIEAIVLDSVSEGNKVGATQALKRKKILEKEILNLDSSRLRLETMIFDIESAMTQRKTLGALNDLSCQFKTVLRHCNPEKIEKTLEELQTSQSTRTKMVQIMQADHNSANSEKELELELLEYEARGRRPKIRFFQSSPLDFDRKLSSLESIPTTIPMGCHFESYAQGRCLTLNSSSTMAAASPSLLLSESEMALEEHCQLLG